MSYSQQKIGKKPLNLIPCSLLSPGNLAVCQTSQALHAILTASWDHVIKDLP